MDNILKLNTDEVINEEVNNIEVDKPVNNGEGETAKTNADIRKIAYKFNGEESEIEIDVNNLDSLKELVEKSKFADVLKSQKSEVREKYNAMSKYATKLGYKDIDEMLSNMDTEYTNSRVKKLMDENKVADEETALKLIKAEDIEKEREAQRLVDDIVAKRSEQLGRVALDDSGKIKKGCEFYDLTNKHIWTEQEAEQMSAYLIDNPSVDIALYIENQYLRKQNLGSVMETKPSQKDVNSKKSNNIEFGKGNGVVDYKNMNYDEFKKLSNEEQARIVAKDYKFYQNILNQKNKLY